MAHYITAHNEGGKAVFHEPPTEPPVLPIPIGTIQILYSTHTFPLNLSTIGDIQEWSTTDSHNAIFADSSRRICPENGTAVCMMAMKPGAGGNFSKSIFHRTMTLDIVVILEGAVEMHLDSGEKRTLKAGDSLVQRATMHHWRNVTPNDGWARWVVFIQAVEEPVKVGELELEGEWH